MSNPSRAWRPWRPEELSKPRQPATPENAVSSEQELARLRAEARQKGYQEGMEQGRKEGYEAGFAQGQEAGMAEGLRRAEEEGKRALAEMLQPLGELIQQANDAFSRMNREVADDMVELAVAVGRFLAREALDQKPEEILALVRELLSDDSGLNGKPRLLLNPADLQLVQEYLSTEIETAGWQLLADESMQRGGCTLITAAGEVDASWEARCENVVRQLRRRPRTPLPAALQANTAPDQDEGEA